jgi:hypothetical protein
VKFCCKIVGWQDQHWTVTDSWCWWVGNIAATAEKDGPVVLVQILGGRRIADGGFPGEVKAHQLLKSFPFPRALIYKTYYWCSQPIKMSSKNCWFAVTRIYH